uniref:B30.2/SPRY domain-containing protein n=1 Tax=Nothobranchius furzeri TaxID=105023 RepID=A0A8C6NNH3_NOTFU
MQANQEQVSTKPDPANTTSVILDPNTAHSNLKLSQGLTSVQYSSKKPLPDNPERCTSRMWVLGANGFISGKHSWTVDVGQGKDWYIGVARESIKRKSAVFLSPTEGFWVIGQCSIDSLWAQTSPRTRIHVKQKPEKITIELDFIKGKVEHVSAEPSLPFSDALSSFSPGVNLSGLMKVDWMTHVPD